MTFDRSDAQIKAQLEMNQRQAEFLETGRGACQWLGLPLICPERSCRRAGCCAGRPSPATYGMPPCLKHYREEMRFLLFGPDKAAEGLEELGLVRDDPRERTEGAMTLIEFLYGRDREALARLRRPKGVPGPRSWESDPDAFTRYMDAGDWRNPGELARRPLASSGGPEGK